MSISNPNPAKLISLGLGFFFFFKQKISIWPKNVMPGWRRVQIKRDTLQLLRDKVCNVELTDHWLDQCLQAPLEQNAALTQLPGRAFLSVKCKFNVILATLARSRKAQNLPSKFAKQQEIG